MTSQEVDLVLSQISKDVVSQLQAHDGDMLAAAQLAAATMEHPDKDIADEFFDGLEI